ncbi:hypothetical protein MMC13_002998 [Lambiella insularis]|nr:hypothetical protein [Lambiella insularis]
MTEVLTISSQHEGAFGTSPRRRSTSQTSFLHHSPYPRPTPNVRSAGYGQVGYDIRFPASVPSSAPSSPRMQQPDFSNQPSYTSTPSSSLSLDESCDFDDEDDIQFPSYDDSSSSSVIEAAAPPSSPDLKAVEDDTAATPHRTESTVFDLDALGVPQVAGDDTAVKVEPSRHVDYLSHTWKEEDIWSSWRHIVAKRGVYTNSSRLENASWRTWAKSKNRLKTISPDSLNWMKDHDVTWLYGPLQTGNRTSFGTRLDPPPHQLSITCSFATKKPILKKRSLSEIMLQRSISSSTLMKQAIDSLRAQQPDSDTIVRRKLGARAYSDYVTAATPMSPTDISAGTPSIADSTSSSGLQTPGERRHIHFNDKVEQCIAINKDIDDHEDDYSAIQDDDSSDDGIIMMKPVHGKERKLSNRITPNGSFSNESKTIAMLPSTTLKYRGDTPEPPEEMPKNKTTFWNVAAKLVTSPSQETLKPSKPSTNFLLDDEDEDADMSWQPPTNPTSRRDSMFANQSRMSGSSFDEDEDIEGRGLRRTPSGMFMPYEEDEDDVVAAGLFGKVVDTVNTAKDIAHVIWNVGWRR